MAENETRVYAIVVCEHCGVKLTDEGDDFGHPIPVCWEPGELTGHPGLFRAKVLEVVPRAALIAAQEEAADADYHAQALAQEVPHA